MAETRNHTHRSWPRAIAIPLFLFACGGFGYWASRPPAALGRDADPAQFSASRALDLLQPISAAPHPIGSVDHDRVRDGLLETLRPLVDEVEIQHSERVSDHRRFEGLVLMARVDNLVARVRGHDSDGAVLLMSHYDSAPTSPGAADDGSAVVAILESLRALREGPPLRNDLIVLFSDGEEAGLLGAQAFFREHRWREDVRLVLNFEARGSGGPAVLFETSAGNGRLVAEFAKAALHPQANSLAYEAYKRMPNDTDLSVAKRAGYAGLNFAFTEGLYDYHTSGDSIEHLSPNSLQHVGETVLALSRRFGNADLDDLSASDRAYFNPIGFWLLRYPLWLHGILIAGFALCLCWALVRGVRNREMRIGSFLCGAGVFLAGTAAFVELSTILLRAVQEHAAAPGLGAWKMVMNPRAVLAGEFLVGVAVFALLVEWLRRGAGRLGPAVVLTVLTLGLWWTGTPFWPLALFNVVLALFLCLLVPWSLPTPSALGLGALAAWWVGFVILSAVAPGSAFLLGWPLLFLLPVTVWAVGRFGDGRRSPAVWSLILAAALPGGMLLTAMTFLIHVNLGNLVPWIASPLAALLLGLLLPLFEEAGGAGRRFLVAGCGLLGLLFLAAPILADFDARHRRPDELFYWVDQHPGNGRWATTDRDLDRWQQRIIGATTATSLGQIVPAQSRALLVSEPHSIDLEMPVLDPIDRGRTDRGEWVEFQLRPSAGCVRVNLYFSGIREAREASINDVPLSAPGVPPETERWIYLAPPPGGLRVRLEALSLESASLRVIQVNYGWPAALNVPPRPPTMMAAPGSLGDTTLLVRDWSLKSVTRP